VPRRLPRRPPRRKPHPRSASSNAPQPPRATLTAFEAEVLPGLEPFAEVELRALRGVEGLQPAAGAVRFAFRGAWTALHALRTVVAVYAVVPFAVPRPKALLGHEHLTRLLAAISAVRRGAPVGESFGSFRLGAAGEGSSVLVRLAETLARETGLAFEPETGELLLRLRRSPPGDGQSGDGWEVLLRLTPRPLSARRWRVCNLPGGLNAGVAAAMLALAEVRADDRLLNAMCGSGTLAIEQALALPPARLLACDTSAAALACARDNARAAGVALELLQADAAALPLPDASFSVVVADPPWGDAVGTHGGNRALYPAFLLEAGRVTAPGGRLVVLTHELRLFEEVLARPAVRARWEPVRSVQVFHGGHRPRLWLLRRLA
jgi:tRNA (guanine6-N2)-methyltransferase